MLNYLLRDAAPFFFKARGKFWNYSKENENSFLREISLEGVASKKKKKGKALRGVSPSRLLITHLSLLFHSLPSSPGLPNASLSSLQLFTVKSAGHLGCAVSVLPSKGATSQWGYWGLEMWLVQTEMCCKYETYFRRL